MKIHKDKNRAKCIAKLNRHLNRKVRGKLVSQNDQQAIKALAKI